MAFPTILSLVPSISTRKGEGFYVELFLICAFPLESKTKEILEEIKCVVAAFGKSRVW